MHLAISSRGRLNHIITTTTSTTDPEYQLWSQINSMVMSWIIENIEANLVNQFLDYTIVRDLWKGVETLFCSGRDKLQIFDLSSKASTLAQGSNTIELFFGQLNNLWKEIDRRMPNSMKCPDGITMFNSYI